MNAVEPLGMVLYFRPCPDAAVWAAVLAALAGWAPPLCPLTALRLADPDQRALPWSPALEETVCADCAANAGRGWLIAGPGELLGAVTLRPEPEQLRCALALARPAAGLVDAFLALIAALHAIHRPGFAGAFDLENRADGELVLQGLDGLRQLPPIFYLDERSLALLGGGRLRAACTLHCARRGRRVAVTAARRPVASAGEHRLAPARRRGAPSGNGTGPTPAPVAGEGRRGDGMNEAMQQLQALLSGANTPAQVFAPTSRYAATPVATWTDAGGTPVAYLRRRFVPPPESFTTVAAHLVVRGDRLDLLAAAYLGDPEAWWRLCDANGVVRPEDLTDAVGRRMRIGTEAGLPGSGT